MEVTAQARLAANEQGQRTQMREKLAEFVAALDAIMTEPQKAPAGQADAKNADLAPLLEKARANSESREHIALFGVAVRPSASGGKIVDGGYFHVSDLTISKAPAPRKGLIIQAKGARLPYHLDVDDKAEVIILGGKYNDRIKVSADVTRPLTIRALDGNDDIEGGRGKDAIFGGSGNDYIDGGGGNDTIHGEGGYDVLYGQDGADTILGGEGRDYIDGGADNDWLWGGGENDVISGGAGRDAIAGDAGDDVIITAGGRDIVSDRQGVNTFYTDAGDLIVANAQSRVLTVTPPAGGLGHSIYIFGGERFTKRMEADLETLRHIPVGREALASLDASGHAAALRPPPVWSEDPGSVLPLDVVLQDLPTGSRSNTVISLDTAYRSFYDETGNAQDWRATPPIVSLMHEIAHAQDHAYGAGAKGSTLENGVLTDNKELSATGLPWDRNGDGVPDPNRRAVTENALRRELGWPLRPSYGEPPPPRTDKPAS